MNSKLFYCRYACLKLTKNQHLGEVMITRRKFIAGCTLVPLLSYLKFETAFAATPPTILVMAMMLDNMTSLDPHESFEAVGGEVIGNLYQQLVKPNIANPEIIEGDLAESWKVSDDSKTFTFFLHQNSKFADGSIVTAEDAAFSFQRLIKMDKSPAFIINQFGFTKDNVEQHIKAIDKFTLQFTIDEPTSESLLLYCLAA